MLKGISPLVSPELLQVLCTMGHTEEIAFIDANCPLPQGHPKVLRADGVPLVPLLEAVLALLPIDQFTENAVFRSTVGNDPAVIAPVYQDVIDLCATCLPGRKLVPLLNAEFGDRLKQAAAIVVTGERRLYANVVLRKGVIEAE